LAKIADNCDHNIDPWPKLSHKINSRSTSKASEPKVLPPPNLDRVPELVKEDLLVAVAPPQVHGEPAKEKRVEDSGKKLSWSS
jgi:hypothetical protein